MLFNSTVFLFAFLPIVFSFFFLIARFSAKAARLWLALASLFFYAWWNPVYLPLLLVSATFNWFVGSALQGRFAPGWISRKTLLVAGIATNLLVLVYFKYLGFLLGVVAGLAGHARPDVDIVLPLAISFYTFQKIAFLADSYAGKIKSTPIVEYLLFISFFPQLIAGPIVHYSEVVPQYQDPKTFRINALNVHDGLILLIVGLAKKVVLADEFGRFANEAFDAAARGADVTFAAAWIGVLAYTLQLYFDFSGYTDMAIGLAKMFNITLPLNFNSPYKAHNIIDFWRRWHMTLSRFLRDYLYIPLGGNRLGTARRYANLMLTMLIGGLWHGAGWTFLAWGALHGGYLLVNHAWLSLRQKFPRLRLGVPLSHLFTLLAVVVAWVPFRAANFAAAVRMYDGMLGLNGAYLPQQILNMFPFLRVGFRGMGVVPYLGGETVMGVLVIVALLLMGYGIALLAPNSNHIGRGRGRLIVVLSFAFVLQRIVFADDMSPFLYFQF